eukprot:XP_017945850.1 PREDICTED: cytochrome P450 11B, mitochondrial-like [Xenopus tropicalis]
MALNAHTFAPGLNGKQTLTPKASTLRDAAQTRKKPRNLQYKGVSALSVDPGCKLQKATGASHVNLYIEEIVLSQLPFNYGLISLVPSLPFLLLYQPQYSTSSSPSFPPSSSSRNGEDWRSDRLILNKEVLSLTGVKKFLPFLDEVANDFVSFLMRRINKNTRGTLTVDLYADLFRFTMEASGYVLYGQRLGLLEEHPNEDSLRFIRAVETMIKTTLPLVYLPHQLLRLTDSALWTQHMEAWDVIFQQADRCIQNIYQEFCLGQERGYSGIMAELLLQGELPLDSITANVTELMAGGVDTTAMPLLFTLFELARNPSVQQELRAEIKRAEGQCPKDMNQLLNSMPLLKGAIKETLRLYPVGITVQRYPMKDIVLQNYHIPAGTLVQVGLYPMGRSSELFQNPLRYDPTRWMRRDETNFKALAFGFGSRQCIGRRIAETEMMLFLMHMIKNFQINTVCKDDIKTVFRFILMPEKPPLLTFRPV